MTSLTNRFVFLASTMFFFTHHLIFGHLWDNRTYLPLTAWSRTFYKIKNDAWARVVLSFLSTFLMYLKYVLLPLSSFSPDIYEDMKVQTSWSNISVNSARSTPDIGPSGFITCDTYCMSHGTRKIMYVPLELIGTPEIVIYSLSWSLRWTRKWHFLNLKIIWVTLILLCIYMFI